MTPTAEEVRSQQGGQAHDGGPDQEVEQHGQPEEDAAPGGAGPGVPISGDSGCVRGVFAGLGHLLVAYSVRLRLRAFLRLI